MRIVKTLLTSLFITAASYAAELPDTGISGVYEVMVGTDEAAQVLRHFSEFGFRVVEEAAMDAVAAKRVYGVNSALKSYRLQNGAIDSHGLLRVLEWQSLQGPGVGYAPPETIGQRMAVMRTRDIIRLHDVFTDLRETAEQPWLPTEAVFDDLYDMEDGKLAIDNRRVGVREMGVWGELFNHVFYQRYGYQIPGYGTVGEDAPLQTSEFTHHDFIVAGEIGQVSAYYSDVLGLKAEGDPVIDGDWQAGPRAVFMMEPGESHWYRGFVSPNNICGKIKLFAPVDPEYVRDRSARQAVGAGGHNAAFLVHPAP